METPNLPEEKSGILSEAEAYHAGKKIVDVVLTISIIQMALGQLISLITGTFALLNILQIVFWCFIFYKIYNGRAWAKWWYVIGTGFSAVILAGLMQAALQRGMALSGAVLWVAVQIALGYAVAIPCACVLVFSKGVRAFFSYHEV